MEIRTADESGVTVMSVSGRLDSVTSGALSTEVKNRIAAGWTWLVLDLSALDYISSAGLRVFLIAACTLRDKGALGPRAAADGPAGPGDCRRDVAAEGLRLRRRRGGGVEAGRRGGAISPPRAPPSPTADGGAAARSARTGSWS